jgi:hypothetical protein
MPANSESASRWHEAAALASFTFYEASGSEERWAGGFAADGTRVEVITSIDGDEVSVQSARQTRAVPDVLRRRTTIGDLLWRHAVENDGDLTLPYTITIEADDRVVTVDGDEYTALGMRVGGDPRWVGTMRIGDVTVTIRTASPAALALRACVDPSSLPELPPHPH